MWLRRSPRPSIRALFALWWVGILLARIAPGALADILGTHGEPGQRPVATALLQAVGWIGSIVLLRALVGLTLCGWVNTRWQRICAAAFLLSLLTGLVPSLSTLSILLAVPWLVTSVRWRDRLGAKGITVAAASGLLSVVLCGVAFGPDQELRRATTVLSGMARFWDHIVPIALLYSFVSMIRAAIRIRLSVRRIGRRLVVSHLLSGLIPGGLAAVFLLLSSALFLSTYRGIIAGRILSAACVSATERLVRFDSLDSLPFGDEVPGQVLITRNADEPVRIRGGMPPVGADSLLARDESLPAAPLLWDGETLFLRAHVDTLREGRRMRIEALAPVDSLRMLRISEVLGIPVRISPSLEVDYSRGGITIDVGGKGSRRPSIGPADGRGGGLPGGATISCLSRYRGEWVRTAIPIFSSAGFGEPLLALFSIARENPLATVALVALGVIAFLIVGAIWVTTAMVYGLGRSITRAVNVLTDAATALGEGKLEHRITIQGQDELWRVAASFNKMAEGLGRMRAMELEAERIEEELRLARQIQNRLLPEKPPSLERLELAGVSLPAREVGGDYFDYLLLESGQVGIAVADVSGKGVGAALLMSSFRASLRSQDLAGLGPAQTAALLNRFVCSSVDPGKFITAFLGLFDPATGELRYVNAGHESPVLLMPDGTAAELDRGGLIIGAFPGSEYEEGRIQMPSGSLLAVFTDGVTEARDPEGDFFGGERLLGILRGAGDSACPELLQRVVAEVQDFTRGAPQSDDITLLLARSR